jgi:hypothetical protein
MHITFAIGSNAWHDGVIHAASSIRESALCCGWEHENYDVRTAYIMDCSAIEVRLDGGRKSDNSICFFTSRNFSRKHHHLRDLSHRRLTIMHSFKTYVNHESTCVHARGHFGETIKQ